MPIITELLSIGHKVIIASDGASLKLLKKEFPELPFEELPSYKITYPENGNFVWHMAKSVPAILKAIHSENKVLGDLVQKHLVDVVISDNRYGMHHLGVKSIFITHQTQLQLPLGQSAMAALQNKIINSFDEVWIPDVEENPNLSGELSHNNKVPKNAKYIGVLSRFEKNQYGTPIEGFSVDEPFVLVVISGPEPQRSIFEKLAISQSGTVKMPVVVVGGNLELKKEKISSTVIHYPFLQAKELAWLIQKSSTIIMRSGYSSVMDLVALQKAAVLVPTPGQTEQEYLAKHLSSTGMFYTMNQTVFDLRNAVEKVGELTPKKLLNLQEYSQKRAMLLNNI
jgi:predicted glycosyltransferase